MYVCLYTLTTVTMSSVCHTDDHSCVDLSLVDGKEGSDYINASWIDVSTDPIYTCMCHYYDT